MNDPTQPNLTAIAAAIQQQLEPDSLAMPKDCNQFNGELGGIRLRGTVKTDRIRIHLHLDHLTVEQVNAIIDLLKSPTRSCSNCQHYRDWNFPGSHEEPPDHGWDCGHPDPSNFPSVDFDEENACETDEAAAQLYAKDCPGYAYKAPSTAAPFDDYEEPLTAEQLTELQRLAVESDTARLTEQGLLDADGQPTDAYFRAADDAYDAQRGS